MKTIFMAKSYPRPPKKYSYPHLIWVWMFALLLLVVFAFAGCTDSTALKTATYEETVDGVLWEVTYNTETREVVSAKTPLAMFEFDRYSAFYKFMAEYTSNSNIEVIRSSALSCKPVGDSVYKIEKTETYKVACSRSDYEVIKQTFPSCVYSETVSSYEVTDYATGETSTVTTTVTEVTFASYVTTYEQKIVFTVPEA